MDKHYRSYALNSYAAWTSLHQKNNFCRNHNKDAEKWYFQNHRHHLFLDVYLIGLGYIVFVIPKYKFFSQRKYHIITFYDHPSNVF